MGLCGKLLGKRVLVDSMQNTLPESMSFHFSGCIYLCGNPGGLLGSMVCNGRTGIKREEALKIME